MEGSWGFPWGFYDFTVILWETFHPGLLQAVNHGPIFFWGNWWFYRGFWEWFWVILAVDLCE
jgi:hypothetical protein